MISHDSGIESYPVGIVFGAGIRNKSPSRIFSDRLQGASQFYKKGIIKKILISGDNSLESYDEPEAGKQFLISQGIPQEDIILDYAGFRTFDTCARAKKVFNIQRAILFTQEFHLPRALFLCHSFGIESKGFASDFQKYRGSLRFQTREYLAQILGFWERVFLPHDPKFLGEPIDIFPEEKQKESS